MEMPPAFEGSFADPAGIQNLIDRVVEVMDDAGWVWVHVIPSETETQKTVEIHIVAKSDGELC